MAQTTAAVTVPTEAEAQSPDADPLEPLLRLAGPLDEVHALVMAERGIDLMCALIKRGCLAATAIRPSHKPDADGYGLVIADLTASELPPEALIRRGRAALRPGGRLIARVRGSRHAAALARRLRLNGFRGLRTLTLAGQTLVRADLRRAA